MSERRPHLSAWLRTENTGWYLCYIALAILVLGGALGLSGVRLFFVYMSLGLVLFVGGCIWAVVHAEPSKEDHPRKE